MRLFETGAGISVSPPIIMRSEEVERFSFFTSNVSDLSTNYLFPQHLNLAVSKHPPFLKYFENTPSLSSFFVNSGDLFEETLTLSSLVCCSPSWISSSSNAEDNFDDSQERRFELSFLAAFNETTNKDN